MKKKYNFFRKTILLTIGLTLLFGINEKIFGETFNSVLDYATGSDFSVVIDENGDIFSWGSNEYGQLGNGTTEFKLEPNRIFTADDGDILPKFSKIDAGFGVVLAIDIHGDIWVFGNNETGQLGIGNDNMNIYRPYKVTVSNKGSALPKFANVRTDYLTSFAIDTNGDLWAWGDEYSDAPEKIDGISNIKDVAIGNKVFYALDNFGKLYNLSNGIEIKTNSGNDLPIINQVSLCDDSLLILDENGKLWKIKNDILEFEESEISFGVDEDVTVVLPKFIFLSKKSVIDEEGNIWSIRGSDLPTKIKPEDEKTKFISIDTSLNHGNSFTLALDNNKYIWSLSNNSNIIKAIGRQDESLEEPILVYSNEVEDNLEPKLEEVNNESKLEEVNNEPKLEEVNNEPKLEEANTENIDKPLSDSITLVPDEDDTIKSIDETATDTGSTLKITDINITVEELKVPVVNMVSENDTIIRGKGTPNATISMTFKDDKNIIVKTKVRDDGTWELSVPPDTSMKGEIFAMQEDDKGNVSPKLDIFVKTEKTLIMGDIAMNVDDFKTSISDIESLTDADVIKNSGLKAWNVQTGENLINKIKIDKSAIKKQPGTYPIAISVDILSAVLGKDASNQDAVIVQMTVGENTLPYTGEYFKSNNLKVLEKAITFKYNNYWDQH
ncbi:MAG: Ig-like domain-containing protein [Oscillospiraceae bacterium]|nr:Ig-like domain-containing protein [Oscillospiraceae bacterium]